MGMSAETRQEHLEHMGPLLELAATDNSQELSRLQDVLHSSPQGQEFINQLHDKKLITYETWNKLSRSESHSVPKAEWE